MLRRAGTAAAAAAVTMGLAPAAASAAAIAVPECSPYIAGERTVTVHGAGFAPNSFVRLNADGNVIGSAQADATGSFQTAVLPPPLSSINRNLQTFQLTADDGLGNVAGAPLQVTRITADMPDRARPRSRVRYRMFGFPPGRTIYLHIRRGGKTLGTYTIGKAAGPCGRKTRRMRYMPLRRFRSGTYDYWFQNSRRFDRKAPSVRVKITIVRRIRFG